MIALPHDPTGGIIRPLEGSSLTRKQKDFYTRTFKAWKDQQKASHAFGLFNDGDGFGERKENWGNGEYDTFFFRAAWLHMADPRWHPEGLTIARHQLEIDTIHAGAEKTG